MYETTGYMVDKARADIYLARYILTLADKRGLTHGEKHYMIQTALKLLAAAGDALGDKQGRVSFNEVSSIDATDIPF